MEQLINWWQHIPERINPVFLQLGPVQIRYYGLMYMLSFLAAYFFARFRIKNEKAFFVRQQMDDYITWAILGVLIGARLGYVFFYKIDYFLLRPLEIFWPVQMVDGKAFVGISGMSYHGGLIGVTLSTILFCKKHKINLWSFADFIVPGVALGYTFGRIGNFLNGELYGRVTSVPWGMYFVYAPTYELRHPSQLYEAFFEGIILFFLLWSLRKEISFSGFLFWVYCIGYGTVRFFIEMFRQPDEHLGFVIGHFSMGQLLCLEMILIGSYFIIRNRTKVINIPKRDRFTKSK